jgi:tetratricopeptide (TPR) repeat protein
VIRKREPRWQSAADRARVAAELIEEAASLTDESTIASPADVVRAGLPPPISVELPTASVPPGGTAGRAPDAPPAAPTLDDALDRDPDNLALLVERAARLGAAAHYSAAQLDYERALRVDPAHGEALTGLGVLLSRRGLWTEALPPLRRATEVDPGHAAAWYYLGEALNHVDDLTAAQAAYERAVELEPRNARALHRLGIVLDRRNRPDEATRMYRRSREVSGR